MFKWCLIIMVINIILDSPTHATYALTVQCTRKVCCGTIEPSDQARDFLIHKPALVLMTGNGSESAPNNALQLFSHWHMRDCLAVIIKAILCFWRRASHSNSSTMISCRFFLCIFPRSLVWHRYPAHANKTTETNYRRWLNKARSIMKSCVRCVGAELFPSIWTIVHW